MANIRQVHRFMEDRRRIVLTDGRVGRILRVDTSFPARATIVSVWMGSREDDGPGVAKVDARAVVGPARMA